ncbi:hypothetical protein [Pleionea sp. CnH1-48]|uniref:hypothetical protein n=1 Tax=Pleionea sp. CnH1-48 TaxID=2954494 RepID=UPI002096ACB3|nr:hypothetical protein [Pleionea sp. CnH1-48]MCO7224291.1 hypothetical protein [Pleionea sp. CnH1-48]
MIRLKLLVVILVASLLSACVVKPVGHRHKKVKVGVKTVAVLDAEHRHHNVTVIYKRPAHSRKCWAHKNHWHCHR